MKTAEASAAPTARLPLEEGPIRSVLCALGRSVVPAQRKEKGKGPWGLDFSEGCHSHKLGRTVPRHHETPKRVHVHVCSVERLV